ncbi:MAG: hypothetical protein WC528_01515 [Patescibacteria group bacterium]
MISNRSIKILAIAAAVILAGDAVLWFSWSSKKDLPLKINLEKSIFSQSEKISFSIKNPSSSIYCLSHEFTSEGDLSVLDSVMYRGLSFDLEKHEATGWKKIQRPTPEGLNQILHEKCGYYSIENLGYALMAYDHKIKVFTQEKYAIIQQITWTQNCSYTWSLPSGTYRLKIYYGFCQKEPSYYGLEPGLLKSVYSSNFEIR